jgi:ribose 5-phosphate isomerase A
MVWSWGLVQDQPCIIENGLFIGMADLVISLDGKSQPIFLRRGGK